MRTWLMAFLRDGESVGGGIGWMRPEGGKRRPEREERWNKRYGEVMDDM